jgi:hypothetical protein
MISGVAGVRSVVKRHCVGFDDVRGRDVLARAQHGDEISIDLEHRHVRARFEKCVREGTRTAADLEHARALRFGFGNTKPRDTVRGFAIHEEVLSEAFLRTQPPLRELRAGMLRGHFNR